MKIKAKTTTTTTIEGTIHKHELLAFVRQTLGIPDGATVDFFTASVDTTYVDDGKPLLFTATWNVDNRPLPDQEMPARVVTLSPVTKEGSDPAGTRT